MVQFFSQHVAVELFINITTLSCIDCTVSSIMDHR